LISKALSEVMDETWVVDFDFNTVKGNYFATSNGGLHILRTNGQEIRLSRREQVLDGWRKCNKST
jgi:hypothetical protein